MGKKRSAIHAIAAFGLALGMAGAKAQDDFPTKPVTLILPLGAGGSHDINSRAITSIIPQYLGQPMIVRLVPGASGQTGTLAAAEAQADGYTLLFSHNYFDQLQPHVADLPYNTTEDFVTVARTNSAGTCLVVRDDAPWQTAEELFEYGRENPGELEFAHSGQWGAGMVPGARLLQWAGVTANLTPYSGGGPSMRALLAGDADISTQSPPTIIGTDGQVRALACADADEEALGDPPSFNELGFPGPIGEMHRVVFAPRGIPEDRLAKLRDAFAQLSEDPTYQRLLGRLAEDNNMMMGDKYEALRVEQGEAYKQLVDSMTGG